MVLGTMYRLASPDRFQRMLSQEPYGNVISDEWRVTLTRRGTFDSRKRENESLPYCFSVANHVCTSVNYSVPTP